MLNKGLHQPRPSIMAANECQQSQRLFYKSTMVTLDAWEINVDQRG